MNKTHLKCPLCRKPLYTHSPEFARGKWTALCQTKGCPLNQLLYDSEEACIDAFENPVRPLRHLSDDETKNIQGLIKKGYSYGQISNKTGRSRSTVFEIARAMREN
jgi:hypothetical protein